jgi:regulator of extracellular matrix RemA (YlzA/DUF370 family)
MLNAGFGNSVATRRIVCILAPDAAPIKRMIADLRPSGKVIDATHGRRTRSVIVTDSDYIILSSLQPETLSGRMENTDE